MTALDLLLEGFESAAHPRGWHGRWIGTSSGKVLRVFHGDTHIGDAKPGSGRDELVQNVAGVISGADRGVGHGEIAALINHAKGSPAPTPRVIPKGGSANELRGGIPRSSLADIRREQALRAGAPHRAGDKVHVVTPQGHVDRGVVEKPAESYDAITSRGTERSRTVQVRWQDGDVTHERPRDLSPGHPPQRLPTTRRATLGKAQGDAAARTRAEILAKSPSAAAELAQHQEIARGAQAAAADRHSGLGREGSAARERGASSLTTEHADTRDKLTNLPQGQTYGLHGPRGQIGHVERTATGWKVTGPTEKHDRAHKTPSSAAGHAMKLQRSAAATPQSADVMARNWRGRQEVAGMNARQSLRAEAEAERQLEIRARTASSSRERAAAQVELERRRGSRTVRPSVREDEMDEPRPDLLGALLERDFSQGKRANLAKSGAAMKDGSFPIQNASDLSNAIQAVGRAKDPDAAKAHIRKRAKALGLTGSLPDSWGSSGS